MQLVRAVEAKFALLARTHHPLDTRSVAHLPHVLHVWMDRNDFASAFVADDTACGVLHLDAECRPLIVQK